MGIFDFLTAKGRERRKLKQEYETLDKGQLQVALAEMYERMMFIGKSIKDRHGWVLGDLSNNAKDTWIVDQFETRMEALLSVIDGRGVYHAFEENGKNYITTKIPDAPKAKFLDFTGANPKLAKMEEKLMGYGLAFGVPEMKKFSKWRDGESFKNGPEVLAPFSQNSLRYHDSVATRKDLLALSSPDEIKKSVMSKDEVEYAKQEMAKYEFINGKLMNIKDTAYDIVGRLNSSTEVVLAMAEEKGVKRDEIFSMIKEMLKSDEFAKKDYLERVDMIIEKYPRIFTAVGNHVGTIAQSIEGISENKKYMPAILSFLKEPQNFNKSYESDKQSSADRLAEYMRRQLRGELDDPPQKGTMKKTMTLTSEKGKNYQQDEGKRKSVSNVKKNVHVAIVGRAKGKNGGME